MPPSLSRDIHIRPQTTMRYHEEPVKVAHARNFFIETESQYQVIISLFFKKNAFFAKVFPQSVDIIQYKGGREYSDPPLLDAPGLREPHLVYTKVDVVSFRIHCILLDTKGLLINIIPGPGQGPIPNIWERCMYLGMLCFSYFLKNFFRTKKVKKSEKSIKVFPATVDIIQYKRSE